MATKRYVAIALAVWMTWASFGGLSANALPDKVVAGFVFPVGAGSSNPANAGGVVFYSTNQPYPVLVGADSWNAGTATTPADFARNIGALGSGWDWVAGDIVVAVVETTRGVNGWNGVNYTTSLNATLDNSGLQDIGNGTLEALPTPMLSVGPDWVDVSWTALTDANGNVVSYELYRNSVSIARVAQGPAPSHNATGLSGQSCFTLAVNYRRDLGTGIYTTTGRSEPECRDVAGENPWISSTVPANAAGGVASLADIVVTFSEAIDPPPSLTWQISGGITLTLNWDAPNIARFSHTTAFVDCTSYQMEITQARDLDGNPLIDHPSDPLIVNPWSFGTVCPAPYTTITVPPSGAVRVAGTASLDVTFSEAMNTASVTVESSPAASFTLSWTGQTRVVASHAAPFTAGRSYTVWVNGTDLGGTTIPHPGPGAPNPWSFTVNRPPTVAFTAPGANECRTGGSTLTISWTMDDPDAPEADLRVWVNYTLGATPGQTTIQNANGFGMTPSVGWPLPVGTGDLQLALVVRDAAGEGANVLSPTVELDSTAPSVSSIVPANGAADVPTNQVIEITFSEAMKATATEGAFTITPSLAGRTYQWSNQGRTLTVYHDTTSFQPATTYAVSFTAAAVDDCDPGLALSPAYSSTFVTGTGAKAPNPPTALRATSVTSSAATISWTAPTTYTPDGTSIVAGNLSNYRVWRATSASGPWTELTPSPTVAAYTDSAVQAGQTYFYKVTAVDARFGESADSGVLTVPIPGDSPPAFDWLLILIPLVVIFLIVGLFLLMRRKKPATAPPKDGTAPARAAGSQGATGAAEVSPPAPAEGEGGEKFIPCPNCGTMVKPTDAECFVCGSKL